MLYDNDDSGDQDDSVSDDGTRMGMEEDEEEESDEVDDIIDVVDYFKTTVGAASDINGAVADAETCEEQSDADADGASLATESTILPYCSSMSETKFLECLNLLEQFGANPQLAREARGIQKAREKRKQRKRIHTKEEEEQDKVECKMAEVKWRAHMWNAIISRWKSSGKMMHIQTQLAMMMGEWQRCKDEFVQVLVGSVFYPPLISNHTRCLLAIGRTWCEIELQSSWQRLLTRRRNGATGSSVGNDVGAGVEGMRMLDVVDSDSDVDAADTSASTDRVSNSIQQGDHAVASSPQTPAAVCAHAPLPDLSDASIPAFKLHHGQMLLTHYMKAKLKQLNVDQVCRARCKEAEDKWNEENDSYQLSSAVEQLNLLHMKYVGSEMDASASHRELNATKKERQQIFNMHTGTMRKYEEEMARIDRRKAMAQRHKIESSAKQEQGK